MLEGQCGEGNDAEEWSEQGRRGTGDRLSIEGADDDRMGALKRNMRLLVSVTTHTVGLYNGKAYSISNIFQHCNLD